MSDNFNNHNLEDDQSIFEGFDEYQKLREEIDELNNTPMDRNGTWMLSYADLMTLLACFFIMLVAMANFEDPGFQSKANSFAQFFRGSLAKTKGEVTDTKISGSEEEKKIIQKRKVIPKPKKKKNLSVKINEEVTRASVSEISPPKDIEVIFSGSAMFAPGKTILSQEVSDSLEVMIDLILERNSDFIILFEGHTDDTDIKNRVYPSNWELSAARAAAVLKKFEKGGIPPENLVAIGYGDSRPTYINRDKRGKSIPKNQRLNRRVVIKVLHSKNAPKDDLGLGVFFRDGNKRKKLPKSNKIKKN